ncbi:MAG: hypothetical protein HFF50_10485 [Lawsonibacter sp.]|nr:hypothetical protein [Lawsonibacter sp.]
MEKIRKKSLFFIQPILSKHPPCIIAFFSTVDNWKTALNALEFSVWFLPERDFLEGAEPSRILKKGLAKFPAPDYNK